ncbi:hypothetical protein GCM10009648_02820 [Tsukamurella spumae]
MTAAELIRTRAPIAPADVATIVDRVAAELLCEWECHHRLHGAVQPDNIVVTFISGSVHTARLIGFVDPELAGTVLARSGDVEPTVHVRDVHQKSYPATESILGGRLDHRTDVYSLACTAFELLTGLRPHGGGTVQDVMRSVIDGTAQDLPLGTQAQRSVLRSAMAPDSAARPITALRFAADFRRAFHEDPTAAITIGTRP